MTQLVLDLFGTETGRGAEFLARHHYDEQEKS